MSDAAQIRVALAGVGARLRLAALLEHAAPALPVAIALEALLLLGWRLAWMGTHSLLFASSVVAFALIIYLVMRARPVSPLTAAQRADHVLSAHDRLTSALTFVDAGASSALHVAAISDGARVAASLDPSQIVALRVPRVALLTPLACLLLGLALLAHPRAPRLEPRPPQPPRFVVEPDALAAERAAVRKMARETNGKDPELAQLAQKLDALLSAVDQQKLTRAEAFAQLAQIEASQKKPMGTPLTPSEELKAATKVLSQSKQTEKLAEMLKKDDLDAAQKELDKLAQQAEERAKDEPTKEEKEAQEELQRALDKASKALNEQQKKEQEQRDKQIEQLKEEQRQLQKKHDQQPEDQETERKLQKNKRELERLEREKEQQAEQRRQLQRLQRDMQEAAEQLRQKMSPQAMKQMAKELGQMEDEIRKLGGSGGQGQMQIAEIKEVLRRAGHQQGQGQGQKGQGKNGQGQEGKDGRGMKLRDFENRADGKGDTLLLDPQHPGNGDTTLIMPMPGDGQGGNDPGDQKGGGDDKGNDPGKNGDGIGDQHDDNMLGDKTRLGAATKTLHAKGQTGAGPSRSQTILGASEKGFSSRDYHKVFDDYHAVVEDVMSQENIPPGYRYYVKRYFQLIRPRE